MAEKKQNKFIGDGTEFVLTNRPRVDISKMKKAAAKKPARKKKK